MNSRPRLVSRFAKWKVVKSKKKLQYIIVFLEAPCMHKSQTDFSKITIANQESVRFNIGTVSIPGKRLTKQGQQFSHFFATSPIDRFFPNTIYNCFKETVTNKSSKALSTK